MAHESEENRDDAAQDNADAERVLRTNSAPVIGWMAIGAAVVVAALVVLQVPATAAVSMLGLPAFIAVLGWACYLRPRVHLHEDGAHIVNILRTYDVPFARVIDIDRRLGVTLDLDTGKRVGVWALPNSGRRVRRQGLSRGVVEPHTPTEVENVIAAHAQWHAVNPGARSTTGQAAQHGNVVTRVQPLPVALCALTVVWALWGMGLSSTL